MAENYRAYVAELTPTVLQGKFGEALSGLLCGLLADIAAEGVNQAVKAPLVRLSTNPDDSLNPLGVETELERYPREGAANHRERIRRAWVDWPFAGHESSIEGQLAAAGYPGARVTFFPAEPGPAGELNYWSQFWVTFPTGTHPVTASGPVVNGFNVGDGTIVGLVGITPQFAALIRGIVRKWKPGHFICRGFFFEFGGKTWGSFNWDDGTVWAGSYAMAF